MTTPQAKIPAARHWEPYPELPREPKDMQQIRPIYYLQEMFVSILTPGYSFRDHPTIIIGAEIPIYHNLTPPVPGMAPPHVIPDCLIAFDVDTDAVWRRVGYDLAQNGKPPDFVMEVASRRTHRNDTIRKRDLYRRIGVPEYWRFDGEGGLYYGQPIIGERLVNGQYERFPLLRYDNGAEGSTSAILNLNFRYRRRRFSIHNPATGAEYEHPQEEIARLRAEMQRLRGES